MTCSVMTSESHTSRCRGETGDLILLEHEALRVLDVIPPMPAPRCTHWYVLIPATFAR